MDYFDTIEFELDQTTAGSAETVYGILPPGGPTTYEVVGAVFVSDAARTASDTDYATVAVKVGSTTLGSFTTQTTGSGGTGNLTAGGRVGMTLSNAASNPVTADSTVLSVAVTKQGSGVALTGKVIARLRARR